MIHRDTELRRIKTALVVDDSADMRMLIEAHLQRYTLRVIAVRDGLEATQVIANDLVDLIITDFRMPRMDGVELLDWCRGRGLHTPVIFTSAEGVRFEREKIALGDCCATYLPKPINSTLLHSAILAADDADHHDYCLHQPINGWTNRRPQKRLGDVHREGR